MVQLSLSGTMRQSNQGIWVPVLVPIVLLVKGLHRVMAQRSQFGGTGKGVTQNIFELPQ